jgi:hypothetical protein
MIGMRQLKRIPAYEGSLILKVQVFLYLVHNISMSLAYTGKSGTGEVAALLCCSPGFTRE